ncbi:TetR/AcrR family transcriptional regulator [Novosphingobium sp. 1949]|uniref:TetR/AcrR family transcriptional regulator n=1 Tax=Novosphingobium organovorum TaxID=2930092 RepID=A0ABT0BHG4_9SPHN|nr:TetR/AcrR family transcriptional regulator [Novosphingobium organovorum]MCJ2184474.1 TetR/AcrR family transcriptional regulator [Novosphingobium organovorum]
METKRKKPSQARSRQTIDTIIEASAQLLAGETGMPFTTNHLAERAGYSVGTIYQYFENREAIVLTLIERERERVETLVAATLAATQGKDPHTRTRALVRCLHEAFARYRAVDPKLVRALVVYSLDHGLPDPPAHFANAILAVWSDHPSATAPLDPAEAYVIGRSVVEVLRRAVLQGSPLLGTRALEDAIVRLVTGFFAAGPHPNG